MARSTVCVDSSQKQLTTKQKQDLLDQELKNLVEESRSKAHMNDMTIVRAARPLFDLKSQHRRSVCLGRVWKVFAVLTVISGVLAFDASYRILCIVGRMSSKRILPFWDFTELYDQDCLIDNPHFTRTSAKAVDCSVCNDLDVDGIEAIESANPDEIFNDYLSVGRPVVVRGEMSDWPCMKPESRLNGKRIRELYTSNNAVKATPCQFTVPYESHDRDRQISDVLHRMEKGEQVLAGWENCDLDAAKVLRIEYQRPYCLSEVTEMSNTNWIFVAVNGSGESSWNILPAFVSKGVWFAVVDGELDVTVNPNEICYSSCRPMSRTLTTGDIFLYTTEMWYVQLSHRTRDEAVAIASTVSWHLS